MRNACKRSERSLLATRRVRHNIFHLASRADASRCDLHFSLSPHGNGDGFGPTIPRRSRRKTFSRLAQSAVDRFVGIALFSPHTRRTHDREQTHDEARKPTAVLLFTAKRLSSYSIASGRTTGSLQSPLNTQGATWLGRRAARLRFDCTSTLAAAAQHGSSRPATTHSPTLARPDTPRSVRPGASVIASNRSRKGFRVLCPPGTWAFLGAFLCALAASSEGRSHGERSSVDLLRRIRARHAVTPYSRCPTRVAATIRRPLQTTPHVKEDGSMARDAAARTRPIDDACSDAETPSATAAR